MLSLTGNVFYFSDSGPHYSPQNVSDDLHIEFGFIDSVPASHQIPHLRQTLHIDVLRNNLSLNRCSYHTAIHLARIYHSLAITFRSLIRTIGVWVRKALPSQKCNLFHQRSMDHVVELQTLVLVDWSFCNVVSYADHPHEVLWILWRQSCSAVKK